MYLHTYTVYTYIYIGCIYTHIRIYMHGKYIVVYTYISTLPARVSVGHKHHFRLPVGLENGLGIAKNVFKMVASLGSCLAYGFEGSELSGLLRRGQGSELRGIRLMDKILHYPL